MPDKAWNLQLTKLPSTLSIEFTVSVADRDGGDMGSVSHLIPVESKVVSDTQPLLLKTTINKAQYMPEPTLPRTGVQVTLTLKPYDKAINSSNKIFKLREADI